LNILGLNISWGAPEQKDISLDTLIKRFDAIYETTSGISVTPENCEQSPTVKAIITAVTRRFAVMPVHVFLKSRKDGRESKELLASHPVERLLNRPNDWQSRTSYWMDAASRMLRYGNFYALKARGVTGPIRRLEPLPPSDCDPIQRSDWSVIYKITLPGGKFEELAPSQIHHARGTARDGVKGDSPVMDVREAIAMEIAAEKMGASLFGNGAMPGLVLNYMDGSQGFKSDAERNAFLETVQAAYTKKKRFRAMLLPKGIGVGTQIPVENDKAQFIQTRQYQRTVIAGAFGCPPHLVGDLSKGTFNNVEMQGIEFTTNVILPMVRMFEAAMEKDLLTDDDRNGGVIIRFNPDAILRGDFKSRQEGLAIQRQNGVINANDWRENENMNPISAEDGGDEYWRQGPSGQSAASGEPRPASDGSSPEDNANDD
jgi:HK97 family phage portal protein